MAVQGTKVSDVRAGVKLLSGLLKKIDAEGNNNKALTRAEIREFTDSWGDEGGAFDTAVNRVFSYAQARFDVTAPTVKQLNSALSDAMKAIANGDTNKSGNVSPTERRALATTWRAVVDFAKEYQGSTVRDVMGLNGAP